MQKKFKAKGFTLIEIIIAMSVLFIGIISVFALFTSSFNLTNLSKAITLMTYIGESKVEELVAVGPDNLTVTGEDGVKFTLEELGSYTSDAGLASKLRDSRVIISSAGSNPINSNEILIKVDVEMILYLKSGTQKTEHFITYLSKATH